MGDTQNESDSRIAQMGLDRPGVLFGVGGHEFITRPDYGAEGVPVVRLDGLTEADLNLELLYEDYMAGEVSILDTHDRHTEVAISRRVLSILADELNRAANDQPTGNVEAAVEAAYEALGHDGPVDVQ